MIHSRNIRSGFTLLEVLIASVIFVLSMIALVQTGITSLRSVAGSEKLFRAVQLAALKMAEYEVEFQGQIDKEGVKDKEMAKENGSFDAPYEEYKWTAILSQSPLQLNRAALTELLTSFGLDEDSAENQIEQQRLTIGNLNKAIKENLAQITVLIEWNEYGRNRTLPLVTHIIPKEPKIVLSTNVDFEAGTESEESGDTPASEGGP